MGGIFIFLVIGAIVFFVVKSGQATQEQWKTAAQRLHLTYRPGGGMGLSGGIYGTLNDHRVEVSTFTKGSGNSSSTYTRYRIEYRNPVPVDMKITRQGMMQGIGKAFGMQDIEVGNPAFDDYLLVKGADPDAVRGFLSIEIQSAIRDLAFTYSNVTITGTYAQIDKSGKESDAGIMVNTVRRLAGFCETMMEADRNEAAVAAPEVEVDAAPSGMPIIEIEPPEIPFDQLPSANPIVPEPPEIPALPDDPEFPDEELTEVSLPEELMVEEEMLTEIEALKDPGDPIDLPEQGPLDLVETAKQLFGDSGGSLLVSSQFDEQCKGRKITGSGELIRVSRISYDPIFTDTKGAKATISVCQLAGTYSKIKVVAEVMYPREEYDQLDARVGMTLPVSGRLVAQDSMMHRLYVVAD